MRRPFVHDCFFMDCTRCSWSLRLSHGRRRIDNRGDCLTVEGRPSGGQSLPCLPCRSLRTSFRRRSFDVPAEAHGLVPGEHGVAVRWGHANLGRAATARRRWRYQLYCPVAGRRSRRRRLFLVGPRQRPDEVDDGQHRVCPLAGLPDRLGQVPWPPTLWSRRSRRSSRRPWTARLTRRAAPDPAPTTAAGAAARPCWPALRARRGAGRGRASPGRAAGSRARRPRRRPRRA